jgi:ribonuclease D
MLPSGFKASLQLIRDRAGIEALSEKLRAAPVIGLDTEFIREKTFYPAIALIQVATREEAWLIDPVSLRRDDLAPFLGVLRDPKVLKVLHAAYADQECLFWEYDCLAEPVVDTAVAAALCGLGDNVGLGNLLRDQLKVNLPKGLARAKWLDRPLPKELLEYAVLDVAYLVQLWESLEKRLAEKRRVEWALEESRHEASHFDEPPDEIARRVAKSASLDPKTCACLLNLVEWRENRAKTANLPRNWVADNETLRSIAKVKPKSMDELANFRGLNRREVSQEGNVILDAVSRGKNGPGKVWATGPRGTIPTEAEERAVDLIKTYVNWLASKEQIAPRFLMSGDKYFHLLQHSAEGPKGWVERGVLSARAGELVGQALLEFLEGKRGLSIQDRQVRVFPLAPSGDGA